ncbi:MAG: recombinase family protein, partial [Oscillospiraceae bacterium]|nr:recombinase family protein [Oscillospiraceae bacterium]
MKEIVDYETDEKILSRNVAIYVRVSTEEQAKHGFSIKGQIAKLKQYCEAMDWHVVDVYVDDGISGKNVVDRPEINRMLSDIKARKIDTVLIYKVDRLTRNLKDLIELVEFFNQNGCDFCSLQESIDTKTATGRMFLKIVGIFAEFERENIAERTRFGLEKKARDGYALITGISALGYD